MSFFVRTLVCVLVLAPFWQASAAPSCTAGTTKTCSNEGGCKGTQYCFGDPSEPGGGEWSECIPHNQPQSCTACGAGGTAVCVDGELGPCRPSTAQSLDACGNHCDDDRDGEADEGCAGSATFDYCERNPSGGGYTRWTCGCGDGLNVGYCLGSGDSQSSCSNASGCLKAPAFGTSGASQAGGNYQCCVSSRPCYAEGYDTAALLCSPLNTPNFECTPDASCDDSNACGNTCAGLTPQVDRMTGTRVGSGAYCASGPVCSQAQGGFGTPGGGVRAMMDSYMEVCGLTTWDFGMSYVCSEVPYRPLPVPSLPPKETPGGGGGGGGGYDGDDDEDGDSKDPAPETCGPSTNGTAVVGAAVSAMSVPRVQLGDFTTRHTEADLGLYGELGGFNFVRKYVSTDNFWSYQSMLGASGQPFVPKPFGSSPGRQTSLRWWHSLYSFVHQKGITPGVSTWAVRDTEGEVLEFFACQSTGSGCFARPRKTSRWSNASLFWTGSAYVLIKPGEGRYVYASGWAANGGPARRYFLTRIEEDRLTGAPRVRLTLEYAPQTLVNQYNQPVTCPGQSSIGNGVPYLSTVTTEEGSKLRLYYRTITSLHSSPGLECVLDRLAMRNNPNSSDAALSQQEVGEYDSRGNSTQVTSPQGGVTTFLYRGGRLEGMTSQGLTSTLLHDGAQLRAARRPAGDYTVYCYRTGTRRRGRAARAGRRRRCSSGWPPPAMRTASTGAR